jgi:hypothetical protein
MKDMESIKKMRPFSAGIGLGREREGEGRETFPTSVATAADDFFWAGNN